MKTSNLCPEKQVESLRLLVIEIIHGCSSEDDKANNLRSHHRKLDQNLLLIVKQKNAESKKEEWVFPEKNYEGEASLRAVRISRLNSQ